MTLVIQLFVIPGGWPEHLLWFALLLLIVARGPGAISLDHLIRNGIASTVDGDRLDHIEREILTTEMPE